MTGLHLHQLERCVVCGGSTRRGETTLEYDFGDIKINVVEVPAAICVDCGEAYVPGVIGVVIGDVVTQFADRLRALVEEDEQRAPSKIETTFDGSRLSNHNRARDWVAV